MAKRPVTALLMGICYQNLAAITVRSRGIYVYYWYNCYFSAYQGPGVNAQPDLGTLRQGVAAPAPSAAPRLANPTTVGLFGFAATTWLLSLMNSGLSTADGMGLVLALAFTFGGAAQFVAGIMNYWRGDTFGFTAFMSYGAFWWSFAAFVLFFKDKVPGSFVGWYLFVWGMITLAMFFASFAKPRADQAIFFFLTLTFFCLAAGDGFGMPAIGHLGGYLGLVTAIVAFYTGMAVVVNDSFGRTVLPIGAP